MPIAASLLTTAIFNQMNANKLVGRDGIKLADAIGTSVSNYLMTPNLVSCFLSGTAGPTGNINSVGVIGLVPSIMSGFMVGKAASNNLKGRDMIKLYNSVSNGLCQVLMGMVLTGTAAGIAVGGGVGSFTAISESVLSKLMFLAMQSKKLSGRDTSKLCNVISFGVISQLRSSVKFTAAVTGVVAPVPPVGPVPVVGIPSLFTKIS